MIEFFSSVFVVVVIFSHASDNVHRHAIGILAIIFVRMQLNQRLQSICQSRRRRRRWQRRRKRRSWRGTHCNGYGSAQHTAHSIAHTFQPHIRWGLNAKRNFNRLNINNSLIQLSDCYYYYYVFLFCCAHIGILKMRARTHTHGKLTHSSDPDPDPDTSASALEWNYVNSSFFFTSPSPSILHTIHPHPYACSFISLPFVPYEFCKSAKWKKMWQEIALALLCRWSFARARAHTLDQLF